jgi:hypothetical protein
VGVVDAEVLEQDAMCAVGDAPMVMGLWVREQLAD